MYRILKLIIPYPPPTSHPQACAQCTYTQYIKKKQQVSGYVHKEQNGCIAMYSLQANMGTVVFSLLY